jgi:hypothetical protein
MGSFACTCGHVIRDSGEVCPEAGTFWSDAMWLAYSEAVTRDIAAFFVAQAGGRGKEWLLSHGLFENQS